jgi:hypothetical protein
LTGLSGTVGEPHSDLDVLVAVPGHFLDAEPLAESLGPVVDGEYLAVT